MPKINSPLQKLLLVSLGAVLGVFFSQYEYFEIDTKISISELGIFLMTSLVALYIGNNIKKALSRQQTISTLYQEDVKLFLKRMTILDDKIESGNINFQNIIREMKSGNMSLRSIKKVYGPIDSIQTDKLDDIINSFNLLKISITAIAPVDDTITLNPTQIAEYRSMIDEIKCALLVSIFEL